MSAVVVSFPVVTLIATIRVPNARKAAEQFSATVASTRGLPCELKHEGWANYRVIAANGEAVLFVQAAARK